MIVIFRATQMGSKRCPVCGEMYASRDRATYFYENTCAQGHRWVVYDPKWAMVIEAFWRKANEFLVG
jgi:hypothetical protein